MIGYGVDCLLICGDQYGHQDRLDFGSDPGAVAAPDGRIRETLVSQVSLSLRLKVNPHRWNRCRHSLVQSSRLPSGQWHQFHRDEPQDVDTPTDR